MENERVTNPYRTVENLATASSGSPEPQPPRQMSQTSRTSSEGNLCMDARVLARSGNLRASLDLDTIYDLRRTGSVEDFMPDDMRKYMSIDPSTSKDSGFGEDLLQRFAEQAQSSPPPSLPSSSPPSSIEIGQNAKGMIVTKKVITKRVTRTGPGGETVTETETHEPGEVTYSFSQLQDSASGLPAEVGQFSQHQDTLARAGRSTRPRDHGEAHSGAPGGQGRPTVQPKSILKQTRKSDSPSAERRGITFAESVTGGYELSEQLRGACTTLGTYLVDSTTIQTKELNASLNVIQSEWFTVSSHKLSSVHQVEDFLSEVNEISKRLLEYIVNMTDANGNTAVHYCISHCNLDIASLLMDTELCDINKQNKAGYTPIMLAGLATLHSLQQMDAVRRIFTQGDINARATATQQTALMLAASHGRGETVALLAQSGADLNMQDVDGSTALMCACEHGHLEIVNFLLAQPSIDAGLTDNEGSTALTIAMEAGHKDVGVALYKHLNFPAKPPHSPGAHKKGRKSASSPTPSKFAQR